MKVLWKVKMLDGSVKDIWSKEDSNPIPGDGKFLDGIPVKICGVLTTPNLAELGHHDLAVSAEEQEK
jgi:hypothetical protein